MLREYSQDRKQYGSVAKAEPTPAEEAADEEQAEEQQEGREAAVT